MADTCQFPGCRSFADKGRIYCIGHAKIMGAAKPPKEKAPILKRSEKRVIDMKEYRKKLKEFFDNPANKVCRIQVLPLNEEQKALFSGCKKEAKHYHHPAGRVGENLMPTENGIPLCDNCHEIVERKPLLAKELGLSKSRLFKQSK